MVFQSFHLFPHLSLLENVRRAPEVVQKLSRRESERLALELLDKVGLSQEKNQMPFQLSGGQSQRGAIARALAMRPQVMLYDEPTSALDPGLVQEVLQVMRELKRERLTQVIVTHEMGFAKEVSDRILVFEAGRVKSDSTSIPEVWQ
jgi:polar amino acid transport system ATP-binding protein